MDIEFAHGAAEVALDRFRTDRQPPRDLGVAAPEGDVGQDIGLAGRERHLRPPLLGASHRDRQSLGQLAQAPLQVLVAGIPCEGFVETGLEFKAKCPFKPAFIVSLNNGYYGYLPTPAQHKLGGYTT